MFPDLKARVKKANRPPGEAVYTGVAKDKPTIMTVTRYGDGHCTLTENATIEDCQAVPGQITWINVEGLQDVSLIKALAERFQLHPLTVEDILNVVQRPKVDEYDDYTFITLKSTNWRDESLMISTEQLSIIFSEQVVLTFQDIPSDTITKLRKRLENIHNQKLHKNGADYLVYRLIDATVDQYFLALEGLGEKIELVEDRIIDSPTPQNSRTIYRLKRQMLVLRKVIWPLREVMSHLLYGENTLVTKFTRVYLRDAYDHIAQAIDTVETFRDMLASLLDMYLSALTIRTNDIIKTLTIITTIFIPITAVASIYGMNIKGVPFMASLWGFDAVAGIMFASIVGMILYFRVKRWL